MLRASSSMLLHISKCFDIHVKWVPCHHNIARTQEADGGDGLQVWRVAVNILNQQSRTASKG